MGDRFSNLGRGTQSFCRDVVTFYFDEAATKKIWWLEFAPCRPAALNMTDWQVAETAMKMLEDGASARAIMRWLRGTLGPFPLGTTLDRIWLRSLP
jgi:hypothetical protein